jgi:hypothetical protein
MTTENDIKKMSETMSENDVGKGHGKTTLENNIRKQSGERTSENDSGK